MRYLALALALLALQVTMVAPPTPAVARHKPKPKQTAPCMTCLGTGETTTRGKLETCPECKGKGWIYLPDKPPRRN